MEKLLVTGASGFLGSRIVKHYRAQYEIYAPAHTEMDITDKKSIDAAFYAFKPHIVIHSAAISDVEACGREPESSWKINVDGSGNIAAASAKSGAKCLFCSSDQIYFGSREKGLHKEEETVKPANLYGAQKKKAEEECLKVNPDCVVLRLSWMYDTQTLLAGEHSDFFRTLISRMQKNVEVLSYPIHDVRGITDVNEVVCNLQKAWDLKGGIYNFGSTNDKNTYETVFAMFQELGWDTERLERNEIAFAQNPRHIAMDPKKLAENGITFLPTLKALVKNACSISV